ncbi:Bifunctional DNA Primase/polymerase OS=Myxococcus stipitatus (strain DSM 14675 / JCM 12634 / Mx s8) GN=MYSTI_01949 PE=4 SV=1 [Gemmata massiliana]|uniref:Bifunctional DNA Primase/polymerase n=1 Tax=Gemmata massiliana TaxID=1210884 RepID=A0A6P2D2H2_9BACT|nr:hypothetical protein [Gemmata massiliana]VTR95491.1 Bifunctional DNA Primase/polymerase OS=Myxococcus stipitatus (strain DSM 14675 / JCM 12634 / Mx s8) GN=MYSTI_01949 PE=4 SV=1 [Gemmata massiliana]
MIRELGPALLREQFTRVANGVRVVPGKERGHGMRPDAPARVVGPGGSRGGSWPGVPRLDAVVAHPVLLPDGTLLATNGYHRSIGVLVPDRVTLTVPDVPTRTDAEAAVARLADAVCDFPFERPAHRGCGSRAYIATIATRARWR